MPEWKNNLCGADGSVNILPQLPIWTVFARFIPSNKNKRSEYFIINMRNRRKYLVKGRFSGFFYMIMG